MTDRLDIYSCPDCGIMLQALNACDCDCVLKCGDEELELLDANTVDAAVEKHVPVIEKTANGFKVKVGSAPHPMTDEHWIEWIEIIADNRVYKAFLDPGDAPEAEFCIEAASVKAREHCNLHGLWEATA